MKPCDQIIRYANRVYQLGERLKAVKDGRVGPKTPIYSVLGAVLLGFICRAPSFLWMQTVLKDGVFDKALKGVRLAKSDDTLGRSLERVDITDLQEINAAVVKKARENKAFQGGSIGGYLVVAIDGTGVYSSPVERPGFKVREHKGKDGSKKKEYYQQVVSVAYVGKGPRLILGIERVEPGEGEVTAAKRLLERIYKQQKRGFGEIIVADALYAGAPFINAVLEMHKDVVIKVKQEDRGIIRDAEGLFRRRMPDLQKEVLTIREGDEEGKDIRYEVEIHDAEGFTSWEGVEQPLRVLRAKETLIKPDKSREEKPVYYLVTTAPKSSISTEVIWRINHRRWDIENSGFNDLKQNWHFEHCFSHDTQAMVAIWTLLLIAFNLVLLFLNQRSLDPVKRPIIHMALEIMLGLATAEVSLLEDPGG